jgi:hypothetical protein
MSGGRDLVTRPPLGSSSTSAIEVAMAARDPLHLDEQLCFALNSATHAVIRAYAPLLQPLGLTYVDGSLIP